MNVIRPPPYCINKNLPKYSGNTINILQNRYRAKLYIIAAYGAQIPPTEYTPNNAPKPRHAALSQLLRDNTRILSPPIVAAQKTTKKKDAWFLKRLFNEMRQLPNFPARLQASTIGSIGLNFCVRNVNRCDPYDMTTAMAPRTGLEPVTIRLTAERSTYWATEEYALFRCALTSTSSLRISLTFNVRPSSRRTKATAHNF